MVSSLIYRAGSTEQYTTADILASMNSHLNHLNKMITNWGSSFYLTSATSQTLAANVKTITLPDGVAVSPRCNGAINHIDFIDGTDVTLVRTGRIEDFTSTNTIKPTHAMIAGRTIHLNSAYTSALTYNLYYYRIATDIANDANYIDFPDGYESVFVYHAAAEMKMRMRLDATSFLMNEQRIFQALQNDLGSQIAIPFVPIIFEDSRDYLVDF